MNGPAMECGQPRFAGWRARATSLVVPCVVLLAAPGPVQGSRVPLVRGDTIDIARNELEEASLGFARALSSDAGGDVEWLLAPAGIRLQLGGPARSGVSPRQAAASLRGFIRGFDDEQAVLRRTSPVDGSPDRGYAEVLWSGRASGTSGEVHRTFFLGLSRSAGGWQIDELRVLPR